VSYYILQNDETKGPFTIGQLRTMWNSGAITAETLYCQEGFADWLPLRAIIREIEPPATPPPVLPTPPPQFYQPAPQPKKKEIGILAACLLAFVGLMVFAVIRSALVDGPSSSSGGSSGSSPRVAITASVSLSYDSIRISNLDSFDWPGTSIYLNGIMGGYIYRVASIPAGKSITIPLREFTTRGGERFDPDRRKPKEVVVHADGYDGRQIDY
jgi:hypothetical protein